MRKLLLCVGAFILCAFVANAQTLEITNPQDVAEEKLLQFSMDLRSYALELDLSLEDALSLSTKQEEILVLQQNLINNLAINNKDLADQLTQYEKKNSKLKTGLVISGSITVTCLIVTAITILVTGVS